MHCNATFHHFRFLRSTRQMSVSGSVITFSMNEESHRISPIPIQAIVTNVSDLYHAVEKCDWDFSVWGIRPNYTSGLGNCSTYVSSMLVPIIESNKQYSSREHLCMSIMCYRCDITYHVHRTIYLYPPFLHSLTFA